MKTPFRILLVLIISFAMVEAACRCIWAEQGSSWTSAYRPVISTETLHLALIQESPEGRRLTPNLQLLANSPFSERGSYTLRTNSLGTRGPEPDSTRSRKRILFLGDSVTWNDYLAEEDTFPVIIQNTLAPRVEVINGAIGATGIDNYVMRLAELGPELMPDLIIVGLYLNDATPSPAYPQLSLPPLLRYSQYLQLLAEQIGRYVYFHSVDYDRLVATALPLTSDIDINYQAYDGAVPSDCTAEFANALATAKLDWGLGWSESAWRKIKENLNTIKSWADKNNSKLAVILFPVAYQLCNPANRSYPSIRFDQITSELNLTHLDLLAPLQRRDDRSLYIDHCHFSIKGNRFVAETLSEFLEADHLI